MVRLAEVLGGIVTAGHDELDAPVRTFIAACITCLEWRSESRLGILSSPCYLGEETDSWQLCLPGSILAVLRNIQANW